MTARDVIDIRVRHFVLLEWVFLCSYVAGPVALVTYYANLLSTPAEAPEWAQLPVWGHVAFVGFVTAAWLTSFVCMLYWKPDSPVQCPWCGREFSTLASYIIASEYGPLKSCRHCERSLDDKLPAAGKSGKSVPKPTPWDDELM